MAITVELDGVVLTDVRHLSIALTFRSGLQQRDANALQIAMSRQAGNAPDAPADQLTFKSLRGNADTAGITPKGGTIKLTDDNAADTTIGEWQLGSFFVEDYSVRDEGLELIETTTLRANEVKYRKHGGPDTELLDINKR